MATEHKIYSTEAKQCVIRMAEQLGSCFSASEICEQLKYRGHNHSQSTIYRILEEYVKNGELAKANTKNSTTQYYFLKKCAKSSHFTLICKHCKQIFHIDCHLLEEFFGHIYAMHGFKITDQNSEFEGICLNCRNEGFVE